MTRIKKGLIEKYNIDRDQIIDGMQAALNTLNIDIDMEEIRQQWEHPLEANVLGLIVVKLVENYRELETDYQFIERRVNELESFLVTGSNG